jgi:hypothetical protein
VDSVRQNERHHAGLERAHRRADVLGGIAAEIDLDLEVLVPMGLCQRLTRAFAPDLEIPVLGALLHRVGVNRRSCRSH